MAGVKGMKSGRPVEQNSFAEAVRVAALRPIPTNARGRHYLQGIADKLVKFTLDGEAWVVQEVANRLDGKPHQQVRVER
jgi:hypothetical protein